MERAVPAARLLLVFGALLLEIACSGASRYEKALCSRCHERSLSCHIEKRITINSLRAAWENSFHKKLLNEDFKECPHLACVPCHPNLAQLERGQHKNGLPDVSN